MWKTTELIPLLRERGVELSASQVYRLVTDKPERLSMKVLIALCDILDCTPADLIDPYAESAARRKAAGEPAAAWLHDIGYAPDLIVTGLHALDGARYLRDARHADAMLCPAGRLPLLRHH
jgi:DNA-binding Xre family transcriptional regulator